MRLLKLGGRGELSLTNDIFDNVPPYAILSHTWGADEDEVTFNDLEIGSGKTKAGYAKLWFCAKQARRDNIEYFWVDTCCINKANGVELTEAINLMFGWYRDAVKCYVYLSDVSTRTRDHNGQTEQAWQSALRISRWFTRGWTLQELLAPQSLEFFSREEKLLGDKKTLEGLIHETTDIPIAVLRGAPLSNFPIHERLRWVAKRETSRQEDKAYCLLGLFQIFMPLIYGEGDNAFIRLKGEIDRWSLKRPEELRNDQPLVNNEPLRYHSLADFGFRLFILEPGAMESNITGHIQEFNLLHPPAYYALSYAWGQEPMVHRVVINGKTKFIQPSLFHALQRIRPRTGQYYIWVDSLCINQLDISEKNIQVRQMATIYGRASGVLVWLGEEDSTSKIALEFVSQIISSSFKWTNSWWEQYGFTALAQILDRPWFRRGWVLQEAAFSRISTVRCGDDEVYMDHLVMAMDLIRAKIRTIPPSTSSTTDIVPVATLANFHDSPAVRLINIIEDTFRKSPNGDIIHRRMSLETLVDLATFSETTDQRDTIYTLLNLANDIGPLLRPDQSDAIVPDYEKAVLDVYVDFILHCCCRSGLLDIICRPWAPVSYSSAHTFGIKNRVDCTLRTCPSWIASRDNLPFGNPSRRSHYRLHGNPLVGGSQKRTYNAHYGSKPQVSVGKNRDGTCDGSLHARGFMLGEVAQRSTRMANAIIAKDCLGILGTVSHKSHSGLISLPDTIWRTLCADRDKEGEPAPRVYRAAMVQLLEISSEPLKLCDTTNLLDNISSIDTEELLDTEIPDLVKEFLFVIRDVIWNRRTFRSKLDNSTDEPFVGLIPQNAKVGDQLCILYGCSVPVVLRKLPGSADNSCYQLIGDAYVHGIMDGEAVDSASLGSLQSGEANFKIL